jgi:hypothetical protein
LQAATAKIEEMRTMIRGFIKCNFLNEYLFLCQSDHWYPPLNAM